MADDTLQTHQAPIHALRADFATDDITVFEASVAPWDALFTSVGCRTFAHWKDVLVTPSVVVYREWFAAPLKAVGLSPAGMLAISLPECTGDRTRYWGDGVKPGKLPLAAEDCIDAVFDTGQTHGMLLVSRALLQEGLGEETYARLCHAAGQRFLSAPLVVIRELSVWLTDLLRSTQQHSESLRYAAPIQVIEQELLHRMARLADSCVADCRHEPSRPRRRAVHHATQLLHHDNCNDISLRALCESAKVSRRTLEYGFRQHLGISPLQYIRLRRLHAVRKELVFAQRDSMTVTDIAHRNGFIDLGRFARAYYLRFGEKPSQTLRRPPPAEIATLSAPLDWCSLYPGSCRAHRL
jgi:AraC family ethanolamine operon transcriptional activator